MAKKQLSIRRPVTLMVFAVIFGGLINLAIAIPLLHINRLIEVVVAVIVLIISIKTTYYIHEKYLTKYIKK